MPTPRQRSPLREFAPAACATWPNGSTVIFEKTSFALSRRRCGQHPTIASEQTCACPPRPDRVTAVQSINAHIHDVIKPCISHRKAHSAQPACWGTCKTGISRTNLKTALAANTKPLCPTSPAKEMVEPDGIEPTTSCLQSTRSPN